MKDFRKGIVFTFLLFGVSSCLADSVQLARGWNLIAIDSNMAASSLSSYPSITQATGGGMGPGADFTYIAASGSKAAYSYDNMIPGQGYWVYSSSAISVSYTPTGSMDQTVLKRGWNLVNLGSDIEASSLSSYPSITQATGGGMGSGADFTYIAASGSKAAYSYDKSINGQGYWVYSNSTTDVVIPLATNYNYEVLGVGGNNLGVDLGSGYYLKVFSATVNKTTDTASTSGFTAPYGGTVNSTNYVNIKPSIDYDGTKIVFKVVNSTGTVYATSSEITVASGGQPSGAFVLTFGSSVSDTTKPTLSTPSSSNIATTTATISATSNEAGTLYYLVLQSSATAPSADAVVGATSGIKGNDVVTASQSKSFNLTGLTAGTAYSYYIVAKDSAGNLSSVSSGSLTTSVDNNSTFTPPMPPDNTVPSI